MKKRIVISESEKQSILSQHKNVIKEESELKRQSLSERELSKLVNKVLIQEQLEVPGLPEVMGECITDNLKSIKLAQQIKIATGCKDMDVTNCSKALVSVGLELAPQVISNPSILINWGKETMEFANCMSEKFEMKLPIENLASSKTSEMKEAAGCKTNKDCGGLICSNGQCVNRLSKSEVKETEDMDESLTKPTSAPSKVPGCLDGMTYCWSNKKCCPAGTCTAQGCMDPRTGKKIPGGSPMNEELDEIIYEIEMDVEEIDETIYEIEMDEEEVETNEETGKIGCCRSSAKSCGPGFYCMCPSGVCKKVMPIRV
jgi:hypothetical protein